MGGQRIFKFGYEFTFGIYCLKISDDKIYIKILDFFDKDFKIVGVKTVIGIKNLYIFSCHFLKTPIDTRTIITVGFVYTPHR